VFDTEGIAALSNPMSNKHARALSYIEADRGSRRRRPAGTRFVVPATIRVEAGWDRSTPTAAVINRLGIEDHYLDHATTNFAARLRHRHQVSPADAHIGAVIASHAGQEVAVITSDPGDVAVVAAGDAVRIIRL
jgi:hypothetical protein